MSGWRGGCRLCERRWRVFEIATRLGGGAPLYLQPGTNKASDRSMRVTIQIGARSDVAGLAIAGLDKVGIIR
jgi:hypothetical protein